MLLVTMILLWHWP